MNRERSESHCTAILRGGRWCSGRLDFLLHHPELRSSGPGGAPSPSNAKPGAPDSLDARPMYRVRVLGQSRIAGHAGRCTVMSFRLGLRLLGTV